MARTDRAKRIDPAQADGYAEVGRRLIHAARALIERGETRDASALVILGVHATIAYADAVCIHLGGRKSTSADHEAALRLLRAVMGERFPETIARVLQRVLTAKDKFEYQGYLASFKEAQDLFRRAEQIGTWAEGVLAASPRSGK